MARYLIPGFSWLRWFGVLVGLLLLHPGGVWAQPRSVDVSEASRPVALGPALQLMEDPSGQLRLDQVRATEQGWRASPGETLNLGFSRSAWWARVRLHYSGSEPIERVIDIGTPLQDEIDFYLVDERGQLLTSVQAGDRRPFAARAARTRVPTVAVKFSPGQTLDLYLRLATHDGLQEAITLRAWSPQAYAEMVQTDTLTFGLYYGALGTVLLYNLFLFLSTRERAFGLYTAYVTAFFVWSFAFRGYAFQYWWPDSPTFNNQMLPIAAALAYATFGVFTVSYLDTARNAPRWMHRLLWGSLIGNLLAVSPALYNYYALSFALSIPVGTTQIVTALAIGGVLAWRGHRPARYFIIAFVLLAVGVVLYYLRVLGLLPSNLITENFLQIGSALEVLLLAFGLADQMNTLKAEKLRAEQQALSAQSALNSELENLVQRRTRALESANQRLAEMAITDELTGAFNRRHFNSAFPAEMARHLRNRHPLAFCMLDIDQFKLYNDRYGHLAGDNVLQKVASVIDKHLQRAGDQFFRLGGEEFGMLLNVNEPVERALAFIERVRADIEAMGIPHELSSHQVITASFGLVWVTPESPLVRAEDVYAEADSLLYQAKHEGRNRVVVKSV